MRVAVIGAGGQVGSFLVQMLSRRHGVDVIGVCRNIIGSAVIKMCDCEVRIGSVSEPDFAKSALGDADVVINCAIATGLPRHSRRVNRAIIANLANLQRLKRVIHFSSVAVYGSCIDSSRSMFKSPRPDSDYGRGKLDAERYLVRAFRTRRTSAFVIRLGHVFGPNQAMSRGILTMAQTPGFALPFDGSLPSNAIHLNEVGQAVLEMLIGSVPGGVYNLAGNPHRTWREVFDWHTNSVGWRAVQGLSVAVSESGKMLELSRGRFPLIPQLFRETVDWVQVLPSSYVSSCPTARELAYSVLRWLPSDAERRAKAWYSVRMARQSVQRLVEYPKPDPWLSSDEMPGNFFPYPALPQPFLTPISETGEQLRKWYRSLAEPSLQSTSYA